MAGSLIAAILILGGASGFARFNATGRLGADSPSSGASAMAQLIVSVPDVLKDCVRGDRCIVVDTSCSLCCNYIAINARNEKLFFQIFDEACQSAKSAACKCYDLSSYPACVNGTCQLVRWPDENKNSGG